MGSKKQSIWNRPSTSTDRMTDRTRKRHAFSVLSLACLGRAVKKGPKVVKSSEEETADNITGWMESRLHLFFLARKGERERETYVTDKQTRVIF